MRKLGIAAIACLGALVLSCDPKAGDTGVPGGGSPGRKITVAYVTNGVDPFWDLAEAGALAAARELGVECEVLKPPKGIPDQMSMVEGVLTRGVDGIAISPIDAKNQVAFINEACKRTNVITHDSDAPASDRLCFIGMNNYGAGREAGRLVKEAVPDGGQVMIFVGRLEQLNARQRRQGVIDELLDREEQSLQDMKFDPPGFAEKGEKYEILGTRTDNFNKGDAMSNAEDAMVAHPNLACMVGLFAYNAPACLEAAKGAGKAGKVKIVSFDEQDPTLQGIKDGTIHATVSQWPYNYGYESVRILTALARGDKSVLPEGGYLETELRIAKKDNVDAFWSDLKALQKPGK